MRYLIGASMTRDDRTRLSNTIAAFKADCEKVDSLGPQFFQRLARALERVLEERPKTIL